MVFISQSTKKYVMTGKSFRLPEGVYPINYDLLFDVDLEKFRYSGREQIEIEVKKSTREMVLNAVDIDITSATLIQKNKTLKAAIRLKNEKEIVALKFKEKIHGSVKLILEFNGKLNDSLLGFYRSKYTIKNKEKYLATTQFEAPYARRAFPCFDEPQLKATFDVTMKVEKNLKAISNMPIKEEHAEGNKKIIRFHRTPKMSVYLLYLGVGEFEFLQDKLGKTLVRIVTVPGKKKQGKFALDVAKKILSYFQEYSKIPYPLPKLDLVALPDFIVGAMENWGAITFREVYLLFDPETTSTATKQRIAMIIAHEIWHQWSGNLVTMRWWNDLWLNESFATFMSYKAVDHLFPEWDMWEDFINSDTARAFEDDCIKATHPIEVEVQDPHQIEELFDAISYSKGGSVLRMLEGYLGEENFRKGVSDYLAANKYGNATSEDLWGSLSKASNKPIKEIAGRWIKQAGYPLVESNIENGNLVLQQKRFVFNNTDKNLWPIPLVIKTNDNVIVDILDRAKKEIKLGGLTEWFKVNYNQTGFYRVKYLDENLSKLKFLISSKNLPSLDRWGIQNDIFELSVNGELTLENYLDFTRAYYDDDNYLVLSDIYQNMRQIYFVFSQEAFWNSIWPRFKDYHKDVFRKILDRLGWEPKKDENQKDKLLRELALKYLAFAEDQEVVRIGMEKFEGYLKKKELHPDIKSPVFYMVASNGDWFTYKKFIDLYLKTQSPEEKRIILIALGQFKSQDIIKKYLDFSLTPKVRTQDLVIVISAVASNPYGRNVLLPWFKVNWKKIETYEKSGQLFIRILEAFIGAHDSRDKENELREFFRSHKVKYKMTLDRAFEKMERIINWSERNREVLEKYFS